ncbi:hypothetical protein [Edaphovirga cremea]|uniref:hypothetical protein n=1 Tax=Edaphovirga cremea TaxID=2267246 RepID=UPI003CCC5B09
MYQLSDGTDSVLIGIDNKQWPIGMRVDDKTRVEISGEFVKHLLYARMWHSL